MLSLLVLCTFFLLLCLINQAFSSKWRIFWNLLMRLLFLEERLFPFSSLVYLFMQRLTESFQYFTLFQE